MAHIPPETTIADSLEQPKEGTSDGQTFKQHSIPEQIEGAKFLSNKGIGAKKHKGIIVNKYKTS